MVRIYFPLLGFLGVFDEVFDNVFDEIFDKSFDGLFDGFFDCRSRWLKIPL